MQELNLTYPQIRKAIGKTHSVDASNIARLMRNESMVVVTGSNMIGKSKTLIPFLVNRFTIRGYRVSVADFQTTDRFPTFSDGVNKVLGDGPGVLILDEATEISDGSEDKAEISKVIEVSHNRDYKVIPILTCAAGNIAVRNQQTELWLTAGREIHSRIAPAYHLDPLRLDLEIARKLILFLIQSQGIPVDIDRLAYVLETVPTNLGVLEICADILKINRDQDDRYFKSALFDNADRWRGALTAEEVEEMKSKIDNDMFPMF